MATSQYFNNYGAHSEQRLIEDIIVESIKIMGFDAYYLPNDNDAARDLLFGEDPIKKFKSAFPLELYLSNSTEYMGEKEFFSKFGLEIRNNVNVILSKRSFSQRVPQDIFTRPREGDLIYIPFLNGTGELYEIKFTNQTKDFFMLGRKVPYFYELELEKFKFSQELIETGVDVIDQVSTESMYNLTIKVTNVYGSFVDNEIIYQSSDGTYANSSSHGTLISWTPTTGEVSLVNIKGEFTNNTYIYGATSNSKFYIYNLNELGSTPKNENFDNLFIEESASKYVDKTIINPFGTL